MFSIQELSIMMPSAVLSKNWMHALEFYVMFFMLEIAGNGKTKKAEVGQLLL